MNEGSISISHLVTGTLWGATLILGGAAWVVTLSASHHVGALLGMTACCCSAAAAVSHIRCMINKATRRVRASIDMHLVPPGEPLRVMH